MLQKSDEALTMKPCLSNRYNEGSARVRIQCSPNDKGTVVTDNKTEKELTTNLQRMDN